MRKKILFISHEASRTGAPMLLLSIIKDLSIENDIEVLFLTKGELLDEYKIPNVKVFTFESFQSIYSYKNRFLKRIGKKVFLSQIDLQKKAQEYIKTQNYNLIIGNTIASLKFLTSLLPSKNIALYCHELSFSMDLHYIKSSLIKDLKSLPIVLAGSEAVKINLASNYDIDINKIKTIHSFIDQQDTKIHKNKHTLKSELNISKDEIVIGLMGSQEMRKGTDLIPQILKKIIEIDPSLKFKIVSVGGNEENPFTKQIILDINRMNIANKVIFCDKNSFPNDFFNIFDIFLLPSREDPFPLVMHLAAYFKKPIVAFKNSGGIEEVLQDIELAPYLDIDAFSRKIVTLAKNCDMRREYSERLYTTINNNFNKEISINKFKKIIDNY